MSSDTKPGRYVPHQFNAERAMHGSSESFPSTRRPLKKKPPTKKKGGGGAPPLLKGQF